MARQLNNIEMLKDFGSIQISDTIRYSFWTVKASNGKGFMIIKEMRKPKWPPGYWRYFTGSPVMTKPVFEALVKLIELSGEEIKEML